MTPEQIGKSFYLVVKVLARKGGKIQLILVTIPSHLYVLNSGVCPVWASYLTNLHVKYII